MALVTILDLEVKTDAAGTDATLRFSSGAGYNHPSAGGYYLPRLINPLRLSRSAFSNGQTSGGVSVGVGSLDLANTDGALDYMIGYGYAGGRCTVRLVDEAADISTAITVAVLAMEQPEATFKIISLRVRDRLADLEARKVQTNRYAGNNALPAGLEGVAEDLGGRVKVLAKGKNLNVSPAFVNTSRLIFQVNDGAVSDVPAAYDRGASLTKGADYTNQADMETNAPAAGNYRVWKAGGYIRLGSTPTGVVTADVLEGATSADRTAAQILYDLATGPGGIDPADVNSSDVTALDAANSAVVGIWIPTEISCRAAMEQISSSIGAWFGFDRLGVLRMKRFEAPSGSPVATLRVFARAAVPAGSLDVIAIERKPLGDSGRGVPITRATLTYQKCWTVQDSDIAGVATTRQSFLRLDTRQVSSVDASILDQFQNAGTRDFDSLIDDKTAAQTECDRLLVLHKVLRDRYQVTVKITSDLVGVVDLGSVVSLQIDRYGLNSGKLFTVIGIDLDAASGKAVLDLWG